MADHSTRKQSNGAAAEVWENVKQIGLAVILALFIKTSIVEAYKIPSASMEDTLLVGDFLLANKFVYGARLPLVGWRLPAIHEPHRGDVVIFIWPSDGKTKFIKRCVGLPGDTILIRDKQLFVNGKVFPRPEDGPPKWHPKFIDPHVLPRQSGGFNSRDNWGPEVVPPNCYFMMGDNRDDSNDSRFWKSVPKELILGEAMMIHWSWNEENHPSPDVSVSDPLSVPRVFAYNVVHFWEKVRWDRLFRVIH